MVLFTLLLWWMGNANEKTQSSKVKARQCSLIKERASLLILPDDLYVALNQCEVEYKLVLSVTVLSDLRNETVTNLVSLLTNDIQSFQGTIKRFFRISLPNSVKSNTSKTGWSEGSLQISSPLLSQYCSQSSACLYPWSCPAWRMAAGNTLPGASE